MVQVRCSGSCFDLTNVKVSHLRVEFWIENIKQTTRAIVKLCAKKPHLLNCMVADENQSLFPDVSQNLPKTHLT